MSAPVLDPLLARLRLAAARAGAASRETSDALGRLLIEEAVPLLWRTIRSQLAGVPAADQEEVHSAALLRLTEKLQQWLADDSEVEIESFRGYVAATGANGCRAFLRARHPERTRLQNQLRYLLRHDPELALWEGRAGAMVCGFATWSAPAIGATPADAAFSAGERAPDATTPEAAAQPGPRDLALTGPANAIALPELVRRLFLWRGRPWGFREFQSAVAELLGIRDRPLLSLSGEGEGPDGGDAPDSPGSIDPPETRPGAHRELEGRQFLAALWSEVRELPLGQRRALLLNLRDDQGRDRLALFTLTGLADRPELARVLDLAESELAEFWVQLPLDDRTIALRFDLTARQIINLRKSARARLARRMRPQPAPPGGESSPGGRTPADR